MQKGYQNIKQDRKGIKIMCIPTINMIDTGKNIIRLREQVNMSVKDLQDIFGFTTPQAIYKWQHGTALPSLDNLVVLAAIFGVPIEKIIVIENEINNKKTA